MSSPGLSPKRGALIHAEKEKDSNCSQVPAYTGGRQARAHYASALQKSPEIAGFSTTLSDLPS